MEKDGQIDSHALGAKYEISQELREGIRVGIANMGPQKVSKYLENAKGVDPDLKAVIQQELDYMEKHPEQAEKLGIKRDNDPQQDVSKKKDPSEGIAMQFERHVDLQLRQQGIVISNAPIDVQLNALQEVEALKNDTSLAFGFDSNPDMNNLSGSTQTANIAELDQLRKTSEQMLLG